MGSRYYKIPILIVVGFLSILYSGCTTPSSTRGGDKRGNEYIKWLRKVNGDYINFAGFSDVDGDKIPEIIVNTNLDKDVVSYVLDGKDGKVKSVVSRIVEKGNPEEGYGVIEDIPLTSPSRAAYVPIADLDGDSIDDWLTLDDYYLNISDQRASYLTPATGIIKGPGTLLWTNKINNPISSSDISDLTSFWSLPISVLKGYEGNDLIFYSKFTQKLCIVKGNDGTMRWCKEINSDGLSVTDINEDGNEDIITLSRDKFYDKINDILYLPKITALNGKDGGIIWSKELDCKEISASIGDIDGDGEVEIIVSIGVPAGIKILDAVSGDEKYSFSLGMDAGVGKVIIDKIETSTVPVLGDIDGDRGNDIVFEKSESGIEDTNGNGIFGDCVDIDNSGKFEEGECDVSVGGNYIFAFSIQKGVLWKYENYPGEDNIFTFLIADIDSDGKNEVLSNYLGRDESSDFELQAINGEDGTPTFWYGDFKDYNGYTSIKAVKLWGIGDIDDDGLMEVLVTGSGCTEFCRDMVVILLKTDALVPASNSLLPWPLPGQDKYQNNRL